MIIETDVSEWWSVETRHFTPLTGDPVGDIHKLANPIHMKENFLTEGEALVYANILEIEYIMSHNFHVKRKPENV